MHARAHMLTWARLGVRLPIASVSPSWPEPCWPSRAHRPCRGRKRRATACLPWRQMPAPRHSLRPLAEIPSFSLRSEGSGRALLRPTIPIRRSRALTPSVPWCSALHRCCRALAKVTTRSVCAAAPSKLRAPSCRSAATTSGGSRERSRRRGPARRSRADRRGSRRARSRRTGCPDAHP